MGQKKENTSDWRTVAAYYQCPITESGACIYGHNNRRTEVEPHSCGTDTDGNYGGCPEAVKYLKQYIGRTAITREQVVLKTSPDGKNIMVQRGKIWLSINHGEIFTSKD